MRRIRCKPRQETLAQLEQDADREIEELKEMHLDPAQMQVDPQQLTRYGRNIKEPNRIFIYIWIFGIIRYWQLHFRPFHCFMSHRIVHQMYDPSSGPLPPGMNRNLHKRRMTKYVCAVKLASIRSITSTCTWEFSCDGWCLFEVSRL